MEYLESVSRYFFHEVTYILYVKLLFKVSYPSLSSTVFHYNTTSAAAVRHFMAGKEGPLNLSITSPSSPPAIPPIHTIKENCYTKSSINVRGKKEAEGT